MALSCSDKMSGKLLGTSQPMHLKIPTEILENTTVIYLILELKTPASTLACYWILNELFQRSTAISQYLDPKERNRGTVWFPFVDTKWHEILHNIPQDGSISLPDVNILKTRNKVHHRCLQRTLGANPREYGTAFLDTRFI